MEKISFINVFCVVPTGNPVHIPPPDPDTVKEPNREGEENRPPRVVIKYCNMTFTIAFQSNYFLFAVVSGIMFYFL